MNDPQGDAGVEGGQEGQVTLRRDHLWPWIIGIALAVVLAVNAVFIYIAVTGADAVEPSYNTEGR